MDEEQEEPTNWERFKGRIKERKEAFLANKKVEKVTGHFREHKTMYVGIGAAIGAAIVTYVVVQQRNNRSQNVLDSNSFNSLGGVDGGSDMFEAKVFSLFSNKPETNISYTKQTISQYGNKIGRPGIPVWDMTTGKRFESITLAAKSVGVSPSKLWKHLRGDLNHVADHVFRFAEEAEEIANEFN